MLQMFPGELKVSSFRLTLVDKLNWSLARPCPFYQQGRCVFENSCNFVHDITVTAATSSSSSSSSRLPELLDALRDVLDPPDTISLVSEHGVSPHIPGEGWTLVNDASPKEDLLSPVSLPDLQLSRLSTVKTNNDSFDSGYASEWSSPQPLPSTLNLIASPFGSPSTRMGGSRLFSRSPFSPGFASPMNSRDDSPELDSPSNFRRSVATVRAREEEEEDDDDDDDDQYATAQWDVSTDTAAFDDPPHIGSRFSDVSTDMAAFDDPPNISSRFSTSTLALSPDSSDCGSDEEEDSTAHLAYLSSPVQPADENDTIHSLYDVYLHSPPQPQAAFPDVEDRGLIRARVFTPPPLPPPRKFTSTPLRGQVRYLTVFATRYLIFSPPTEPHGLSPLRVLRLA
jgi:hypothetical protein